MSYLQRVVVLCVVVVALGGLYLLLSNNESPLDVGENNEQVMSNVSGETVNYYGSVEGYLAVPNDGEKHPGIVLIHEWWGLTEDMHEMAESFAEEGYVALAVDLYDGQSTSDPAVARQLSGSVRENTDEAFRNLSGALDYLRSLPEVDLEKLASVGWCFGGGWAFQMAVNDLGTDASVMYYGQFDMDHDFEHMRASILGHFGEEDGGIAVDNVREFQAKLETVNGDHEVYIYPNVGHGFANYRGGDNMAYSEEAAELAWQRTQDFLKMVWAE